VDNGIIFITVAAPVTGSSLVTSSEVRGLVKRFYEHAWNR
jgi:hypothetical protein